MRSDEFTYLISTPNYVLNLRYRPHFTECKALYYTLQNHSTVTTKIIYLLVSDERMYYTLQNHSTVTKKIIYLLVSDERMFQISFSYSVPKMRYGPLTLNIKMLTTSHRIIQA